MDDLDHSMHIAECDWTVFYEESEECDLPQPSLACHDSANLSDVEDSGNSSPVCSAGPKGPNSAANRDEDGSSAAGCCLEEKDYSGCEKYTSRPTTQSGTTGEGDLATEAEMRLAPSVGAEHVAKDPGDSAATTAQSQRGKVQRSDEEPPALKGEDGDVQMEGDVRGFKKREPLPGDRAEVDLSESHAADRALRRGVTGASLRGEKERWFVTVNASPAPRRPRAVPVKKKQRRKRNLKGKDTCRPGQDRSHEDGLELQIMREHCEFEGGADPEDVTTENQTRVKDLAEEDPESTHKGILSGASQMSLTPRAEGGWSEELVTPPLPKRSLSEPTTSGESAASDEFEDVVDFSSTHSSDSESYVSAAESLEELAAEQRHSQSSSSLTENQNLFRLSADDDAQGSHVHSRDIALSPSVTAANSEGHGRADATQTFPSAGVDKLAADADTPSETRGPPKRGISHSASGCPSGDRLLSVPDLTVTRCCCCEADSPETYAEATGHARPVYAISAFWAEMERLTINDILQLRTGGSSPPRETVTPPVEDLGSLEDNREHSPCDGRLTDVSSTADSDYFTQPDESKPVDHSSWDFSTSDAEEEYSSGNPSPEPKGDKRRRSSDAPDLAGGEEETSTSNEGNETLVPSEDIARTRPEDEDSNAFTSSRFASPRQMTKSKSVQNVRALNAEHLPAQVLLGDDESCRFLGAEGVLKASGSLLAPIPAPLTDGHYEIVFPEVFQDVSPVIDFPLWTFRDEMPFFSLHNFQRSDEKPIPIFSSSRPTIRELTFSNPPWVFLRADREEDDHFSPIRISSRSFVHGSDCGSAAPHGFYVWKSLVRKIRFPDKGGSWPGTSGSWVVPVEKSSYPPLTALTERRVSSAPSQLFRELAAQQRVWEAFRTTRREGIFSTLKQSDMCLVCIAFASWVLKSSDPDGADAWKAAVLANVSALSAIQYLRHYVKKKNPS
ncbi:perm1 [Pungitius sinensis]